MEELVTVDEVGEDDDSIIEPDLPELDRFVSCPKGTTEGEAVEEKEKEKLSPPPAETSIQDRLSSEAGDPAEPEPEPVLSASSPEKPTQQQQPAAPEPALADAPTEELKAKLEETRLEDKATSEEAPEEAPQNHKSVTEEPESVEAGAVTETAKMEVQPRGKGING